MSPQSRVLVLVVVTLSLVVLAVGPGRTGRASATTAESTLTGSAWVPRPAGALRLTSSSTAKAVTMRALRTGRGAAWRRHRTSPAGGVGARFAARAAVQGHRAGQRVRLVLAEFSSGRELQRHRTTARIVADQKVVLRVPIRRTRAGSSFAVGIVVPRLHRGQRIFASGVTLLRRTARTPLSNGCSAGPRGVPSCGAYLGAAHGSNTDPVDLESATGGRLGVRRTYFTASEVGGAVRMARRDLAHGRLPWMSFKLPYSWSAMAAGRGDAWARDLARRLDALPGPVWIAFHHEPEGDGDITTWRTMQERLGPIVRQTADNVAFTVIVTGWSELYGDAQYRLANLWPRGVKVDVAGFDIYNQYGVVEDGVMTTRATDLQASYFRPLSQWAAAQHVAWGLAESAYTDAASIKDPDWIKRTYTQLDAAGGIAFSYFDTTLHSQGSWALSTQAKKQAYARARVGAPVLPKLS